MRPTEEYLATLTDHTRNYILDLEAEVERLRAVVDQLPRTADGVPILPGIRLWWIERNNPPRFPPTIETAVVESLHPEDWENRFTFGSSGPTEQTKRWFVEPNRSYSTREVAEAAKEAKP